MKYTAFLLLFVVCVAVAGATLLPATSFAQLELIPCGKQVGPDGAIVPGDRCDFWDLLKLGSNLVKYLIYLSIPVAAIAFAWAGFLYVTAGGSQAKMDQAKKVFTKVMWGFIFVLAAWLIVWAIVKFLDPCFSLLSSNSAGTNCPQ